MYFGLSWSCPHEWGVRRTVGKGVHICWCLSQDLTKALRAKLKPVCSPAPQEIKQSERLCCSHTSCPREMKQSERLRCLQTSSVPPVVQLLTHVWRLVAPRAAVHLPCPSPTPELAQTHVHRVGDAIQPSHLVSSPSAPAFNLSQHQGLESCDCERCGPLDP